LQLCHNKEAIKTGAFYDLMWANPHLTRQYLYLRHSEDEKLLFCLNFDSQPVEINVIIPPDAFNIININDDFILKPVFGASGEIFCDNITAETFEVRISLREFRMKVFYLVVH
jgi:hypothetical protein